MRPRGTERGDTKIGCIFWSFMGLIFVMIAVEVLPIKIASMKLQDHMTEMAMTHGQRSRDFHERSIFNKARSLDLDIPRKQIRVKKHPERIIMDVEFTVPLRILTIDYDWNIELHLDRDVFWI